MLWVTKALEFIFHKSELMNQLLPVCYKYIWLTCLSGLLSICLSSSPAIVILKKILIRMDIPGNLLIKRLWISDSNASYRDSFAGVIFLTICSPLGQNCVNTAFRGTARVEGLYIISELYSQSTVDEFLPLLNYYYSGKLGGMISPKGLGFLALSICETILLLEWFYSWDINSEIDLEDCKLGC